MTRSGNTQQLLDAGVGHPSSGGSMSSSCLDEAVTNASLPQGRTAEHVRQLVCRSYLLEGNIRPVWSVSHSSFPVDSNLLAAFHSEDLGETAKVTDDGRC